MAHGSWRHRSHSQLPTNSPNVLLRSHASNLCRYQRQPPAMQCHPPVGGARHVLSSTSKARATAQCATLPAAAFLLAHSARLRLLLPLVASLPVRVRLVASVRLWLVASVLAHSARLRLLLPLVAYLPVRLRLVASVRLRLVPSAVRLPLVASVPVRLRPVASARPLLRPLLVRRPGKRFLLHSPQLAHRQPTALVRRHRAASAYLPASSSPLCTAPLTLC
jgi:hypothetical protein